MSNEKRLSRRHLLQGAAATATAIAGWTLKGVCRDDPTSGSGNLHLARFRFDVTPPMGHSCCGGWITPVVAIDNSDATLIADAFHSWNTNSTLDDLRAVPVERISHYHIDDAHPDIPPLKQLDPDRVMIGDGVIDLKAELTVLKEKCYTGAISLELFNPDLWAQDPCDVLKLGFERLSGLVDSS